MYNRFNFYKNTFAVFTKTVQPENFVKPHHISKHGSRYFFTGEGVYRYSNHWGRVGNCRWRLESVDYKQQTMYWGFCRWEHFYENNEGMPLFFIEQTVDGHFCCNHKNNANGKEVVLRTAADAAKILKKIKELTTETLWAKYLEYDDLDEVKNYFITELIHSSKNFNQIRKDYITLKNKENQNK